MTRIELFLDNLFSQKRWIVHVIFWLLVLALYVVFFGRKNSNYLQTFFFVGLLMPVTIGTTYFLNYFLVPRYLMKESYFLFGIYFFYTLLGSLFLEMVIAMITFIVIAEARIQEMSPASIDIFFLLTSLLMVIFFGAAIKMLLHWRTSKEEYQKLLRDRVESELRFLKTQLNPHFLFNTLNNLYYLAQEKSDKTPRAILALSEILDYVMHSGQYVFVPLEKEWQQAENYINLEMLRYEDRVEIKKNLSGDLQNHTIGPMMLLTLLENSFKHGVMNTARQSIITIEIHGSEHSVSITIQNSKQAPVKGNGIGLANLRNQLVHLYPDKHLLEIDDSDPNLFSVNLKLKK